MPDARRARLESYSRHRRAPSRPVQAVWPELRPYFDDRALDGARKSKLRADPDWLARQVPDDDVANLAATLVRIMLER